MPSTFGLSAIISPPLQSRPLMATKFVKWATVSSSLALGAWGLMITRQVYRVNPSSVNVSDTGDASFLRSRTCSAVVNPRHHWAASDSRSIQLRLPRSKSQYSDEQILATFVKGFFGGWVFAAEGAVLGAAKRTLVGFTGTFTRPIQTTLLTTNTRYSPAS